MLDVTLNKEQDYCFLIFLKLSIDRHNHLLREIFLISVKLNFTVKVMVVVLILE